MHKTIYLPLFLICVCCTKSTEQTMDLNSIISIAAMDSIYFDYQMAILHHQQNIITEKYDLEGIHKAFSTNPNSDICSKDLTYLNDVKGGLVYQELSCIRVTLMKMLKEKYPEIFKNSDAALSDKVQSYFTEHSDRFKAERMKSIDLLYQREINSKKD